MADRVTGRLAPAVALIGSNSLQREGSTSPAAQTIGEDAWADLTIIRNMQQYLAFPCSKARSTDQNLISRKPNTRSANDAPKNSFVLTLCAGVCMCVCVCACVCVCVCVHARACTILEPMCECHHGCELTLGYPHLKGVPSDGSTSVLRSDTHLPIQTNFVRNSDTIRNPKSALLQA